MNNLDDLTSTADTAVLDLIPIGVVVAALDGTVHLANRAARDLLGGGIVGTSCWEVLALPGGHQGLIDRARRASAAGRVAPIETTATANRTIDAGVPVSVALRSMPRDPTRVVITVRPLGEEHRQAVRLRAFEDRFEQLATNVPTGILSSEFGMRVDFANERCTEIFDVPSEDLLGFGWFDRLHPDDAVSTEVAIAEVLTEGCDRNLSLRIRRPGGADRHVEVCLSPVSSGGGRAQYHQGNAPYQHEHAQGPTA